MTEPVARPLLEIRSLHKRFGDLQVLDGVSLEVHRGSVVGLVGESGSGKSTLARIVAGLVKADSGEVHVRGRVQMIFQDPFGSLNPVNRVGYHIERPLLRHKQATPKTVRARVVEFLELVGLTPAAEYVDKFPHALSGGQRQRVAIARALAADPDLLLADEPTSMLDVSIRMDVLNLLDRLRKERGLGLLLITHDLAGARYLADRVLVLYRGHIVEAAPTEQLIHHPGHPYTKVLLSAAASGHPGETATCYADRPPTNAGLRIAEREHLAANPGCPFASRCPEAAVECRDAPPLIEHGEGLVACIRPGRLPAHRASR